LGHLWIITGGETWTDPQGATGAPLAGPQQKLSALIIDLQTSDCHKPTPAQSQRFSYAGSRDDFRKAALAKW
jgi:hypothetical protein